MLRLGKGVRLFDIEAIELIEGPPPVIRSYEEFRPYQKWMANLLIENEGVLLGADMGLGKTGATLYAIRQLLKRKIVSRPLIVAPKHVAQDTWPEEIACWDFARSLTYSVVTGTEEERIRALEYPARVHIINRENLVWLRRYWGKDWPYDMLVYDEASRLKGGKKRTKGSKRKDKTKSPKKLSEFGVLARVRYTFLRVAELSGTPTPNGLIDLWGPVYIIDEGKRLGGSKTAYEQRWFEQNKYSYSVKPLPHAEKEIMGLVSDIFFSLRSEDYLDLPPLVSINRFVSLEQRSMVLYKKFEKERALEEWDVEAANKGVLTNKLLQAANGAMYREEGKPLVEIHEAKLDELESIVAESGGRPIIVAYSFKFDLVKIKKRFKFARIFGEGNNDLRDWNAGKIRMLLVHPASAGHGLNFQHGGHIAVWYGLTWSLELYRQFIKRLHRSGQQADRVFLYHILTKGTADETVLKVLENKGATQDSITNAVRVRLKRVAKRD